MLGAGAHSIIRVMSSTQHKLEFLEDRVLLVISSLGLLCVTAAIFWVVRQSPDWARGGAGHPGGDEDAAGDGVVLGTRTRVVPGGREATKASRKEAKKRAKAEFNRSRQALEGRERRIRLQDEVCLKFETRCHSMLQGWKCGELLSCSDCSLLHSCFRRQVMHRLLYLASAFAPK